MSANNLKYVMIIILVLSTACTVDTLVVDARTSEFALDQSIANIENSLESDEKMLFNKAINSLKGLYLDQSHTKIKGSKRQRIEKYHDLMHGKNAEEIIEIADRLKAQYDTN